MKPAPGTRKRKDIYKFEQVVHVQKLSLVFLCHLGWQPLVGSKKSITITIYTPHRPPNGHPSPRQSDIIK